MIVQKYKQYYTRYNNNSNKCCFIINMQLTCNDLKNYGIQSYIDYCEKYKIDLIVQDNINPNYIIPQFCSYLRNLYYAYTVTQSYFLYQLFDEYQQIMLGSQNDVLMLPNSPNYFQRDCKDKIVLNYGKRYYNLDKHLKSMHDVSIISGIKLVRQFMQNYFGYKQNFLKISWFNNIYLRKHKQLFNIQKFKEYFNYIRLCDPENTSCVWDRYAQGWISKQIQLGNCCFYNQIVDECYIDLYQTAMMNHLQYSDQFGYIKSMVDNPNVHYIHFAGGGLIQNITKIRYNRMKLAYQYTNKLI